jgi:hypothetical protein
MNYCKWEDKDIEGLSSFSGTVILYTEIDKDGNVRREIGFDKEGEVVHRCPSEFFPLGQYGIFDNQKVKISDFSSTISKEEFEKLWERAREKEAG